MNFHTFSLPHEGCVRLQVKELSRGTPENFVSEEIESLNICLQGILKLGSGLRDKDLTKDHPPTLYSLCRWREDLSCRNCDHSPKTAVCECR